MDPTRELIQIRISGWAKHLICGFGITGYTLYRKGGLCDLEGPNHATDSRARSGYSAHCRDAEMWTRSSVPHLRLRNVGCVKCIGGGFLECLEDRGRSCLHGQPFGYSILCQCPVRKYLADHGLV